MGLTTAVVAAAGEDLAAGRKGCETGKAADCRQLGLAHLNGQGVRKSMADARTYLRKACDGGNAAGCSYLGSLYEAGQGAPRDDAGAASLYEKGCNGGDAFGCMRFGFMVAANDGSAAGVFAFMASAAALAKQACDAGQLVAGPGGDLSGCAMLGNLYENGWGVAKDAKRAAELYEKSCVGGDADGCYFLGLTCRSGRGVPKDVGRAAALFERACDATHDLGCGGLAEVGEAYLSGAGVSKDAARAAVLLERACDRGVGSACARLGEMYRSGSGVPKDPPRAAALYKRACVGENCILLSAAQLEQACNSGSAAACSRLGDDHKLGSKDIGKDEARAAALYERACDGGDAKACSDLGDMYSSWEVYGFPSGVSKETARG
jgi:hypothetical protein